MKIGVPKESAPGETRVALVPEAVRTLIRGKHEVVIQAGAGAGSFLSDAAYAQAGATVVPDARQVYDAAEIIFKVAPPLPHVEPDGAEVERIRVGTAYLGFVSPWTRADLLVTFAHREVTAYAVELVPRIARAQSMDALTSMATISGYKAVLLATEHARKMLPLLMTAAGTIPPARVLVLGVGVAGLQAIATAKRLGARVDAFDPRPAVKEQVQSLGASFVEMALSEDAETAGGYAKEQSDAFLRQEREVIGARLGEADIVICAAQVFGKRAPTLLTSEMVRLLRPGAVVVDLAADQGGNCAATQADEIVTLGGVTVIGTLNLPALLPSDASRLYANNLVNLFRYLYPDAGSPPDASDPIAAAVCVTRGGQIVNETQRAAAGVSATGSAAMRTTADATEAGATR